MSRCSVEHSNYKLNNTICLPKSGSFITVERVLRQQYSLPEHMIKSITDTLLSGERSVNVLLDSGLWLKINREILNPRIIRFFLECFRKEETVA